MPVVASFHLTRYPWPQALVTMAGLPLRQRVLAATPGLRFARQLGTGAGPSMGLGADLRRWATFVVWDDEAALDAFLAGSPVAQRWRDRGEETWSVRLTPLSSHGSWGGVDPLAGREANEEAGDDQGGPVVVLTRARVRMRHWPAFYRSVAGVETELRGQPDLLAVVGIGEAPVGLQATFSLWRSRSGMEAFAYRRGPHEAVVRRTRAEGWFTEELFARFRPFGATGTWGGTEPLHLAVPPPGGRHISFWPRQEAVGDDSNATSRRWRLDRGNGS
ncbi:MAG: spheroidene monooxygenase [Actinomycetota bacterium]|nr:spheroidene monooxygenase [Actinomycetota bacterium]